MVVMCAAPSRSRNATNWASVEAGSASFVPKCATDLHVLRERVLQAAHWPPPMTGQGRATVRSDSKETLE